jgi:hypothetical protein
MRDALRSVQQRLRRLWRLLILFLVLRLVAGVVMIAFDGGIARSGELTVIVAVAVVVYGLVALAVRQWAPPRRA